MGEEAVTILCLQKCSCQKYAVIIRNTSVGLGTIQWGLIGNSQRENRATLAESITCNDSSPHSSTSSLVLHIVLVRLVLHINTDVMTHVCQKT